MPELHIEEIVNAVNGNILNYKTNNKDNRIVNFHFDTRSITSEETLFFALKSETCNGHQFVRQLEKRKGVAAVVSKDFNTAGITIPLIQVDDPLKAAQQLASHVRNKYCHIKYVGITGSAGKTTTKEFVHQFLSHKYRAFRSFKNWNNWIGMPFSILNIKGDEEVAVFELAMSSPGIGEIGLLAGILRPDTAVILNAFPVHLEFLKNIDNVASAKSEILNYLEADDIAFINGDLKHLLKKTQLKRGRKIYFGRDVNTNDIILKEIIRHEKETTMIIDFYGIEAQFLTHFINLVHIENLFAGILIAQHLGMKNVEIQEAIKEIKPLPGRGEIKQQGRFTIIDETYNSNPEALKKTLFWVNEEYKEKKIAVIGDMLELGENEDWFHKEVGQFFATLGFDWLITVGLRAQKIAEGAAARGFEAQKIRSFSGSADAGQYLGKAAEPGSVILFKASRGIRLENAIEEFMTNGK